MWEYKKTDRCFGFYALSSKNFRWLEAFRHFHPQNSCSIPAAVAAAAAAAAAALLLPNMLWAALANQGGFQSLASFNKNGWEIQGGPLLVISRFVTPLMGVITQITHL